MVPSRSFSAAPGRARPGKVWLVGAGPGDPELLTLKAARVLAGAEVVAYDELVPREVLALAPPSAERVAVGRRAVGPRYHDERIHPVVVVRALAGRVVVRLKGGDPFVFGRGGEECEALAEAGIPFEVVPGVTAALGVAAATHVPLTHREISSSVTFVTAHAADGSERAFAELPASGTLVVYMGLGRLRAVARALVASGRRAETPVVMVSRASCPGERTLRATLASVAEAANAAALEAPALLIVGDVVARAVASPDPRLLEAAVHYAQAISG